MFAKILRPLPILIPVLMIVCAVALACSSGEPEIVEVERVVEKEVVREVEVPGKTVVVEKEVVREVEVPGKTVVVEKEVVREVEVPGETILVEREVVKEVEVDCRGGEGRKVDAWSKEALRPARSGRRAHNGARPSCTGRATGAPTTAPIPVGMGTPAGFGFAARRDHLPGLRTLPHRPRLGRQRFHVQPGHRSHIVPACAELGARRIRC